MPPCTIASSSAIRTGATIANSTAACPSSAWRPMRRRRVMRGLAVVGPLGARPTTTRTYSALDSLQLADEGLERGLDVASERHEQDDDDGGDEGEDDAVLGHCLAFLALEIVLDPAEQKRSKHLTLLDRDCGPRAARRLR